MLLSPQMVASGPPPQAVLDQRWLWRLLLVLLVITFALRLIGLDIAGALLTMLMLCFGVIMLRDGMAEMANYALVYTMLCGLNFFFDILPLITELGGRTTRSTAPVGMSTDIHGVKETTFTLTTKTTPFFDREQGLIYNVQSLAMIASPICMALGGYLAFTAHTEMQLRDGLPTLDNDLGEFGRQPPAAVLGGRGWTGPTEGSSPSNNNRASQSVRESFERFQGTGHKLS
mmetsp:Transcript_127068/g.253939  ORF Transcript_127068/g.253939 Transcript_127068/m.253939 type:complete len:230 (+) Transcript_127068:82-771(+)